MSFFSLVIVFLLYDGHYKKLFFSSIVCFSFR